MNVLKKGFRKIVVFFILIFLIPLIAAQSIPPLDKSLIKSNDSARVYWFQNNKYYWIIDEPTFNSMKPLWNFSNVKEYSASTFNSQILNNPAYRNGPNFVTEGLLLKKDPESTVFFTENFTENGQRRPLFNYNALVDPAYSFIEADIIKVTQALRDSIPLGEMIYSVGYLSGIETLFRDAFMRNGGTGNLGYARTPAQSWGSGQIQYFRRQGLNSVIVYNPNFNYAFSVYGAINTKYLSGGTGTYGLPIGDESWGIDSTLTGASPRSQRFRGGVNTENSIIHHFTGPKKGLTISMHGIMLEKWSSMGYGASCLGLPVSEVYFWNGMQRQDFEGGYLSNDGQTTRASCEPQDECSPSSTRCLTSSIQQSCGYYNVDPALEWGGDISCTIGCSGSQCNSGPSCSDEIRNQDETDKDCGGICVFQGKKCENSKSCLANSDCISSFCNPLGKCSSPSCSDGWQNQGEFGIDCGGPCLPCSSCSDGILNGDELGVDCGGPCLTCVSCFDNLRNQDETEIDCGGSCSSIGRKCSDGKNCFIDGDCTSSYCRSNICTTKQPVLLVHGIYSNDGIWDRFESELKKRGYDPYRVGNVTNDKGLNPNNGDIVLSANQVNLALSKINKLTGVNKIDVITHSMGGLAARYYINSDLYRNNIRKLIMLGTPNSGSPIVNSWLRPVVNSAGIPGLHGDVPSNDIAAQQMSCNSEFLKNLNSPYNPKGVKHFAIGGTNDFFESVAQPAVLRTELSMLFYDSDGIVPLGNVKIPGFPCYKVFASHYNFPLSDHTAYYDNTQTIDASIDLLDSDTSVLPDCGNVQPVCPEEGIMDFLNLSSKASQGDVITWTVLVGKEILGAPITTVEIIEKAGWEFGAGWAELNQRVFGAIDNGVQNIDYWLKKKIFKLKWSGSTMEMSLTSPSGESVNFTSPTSNPNLTILNGSTFNTFILENAELGNWTVAVKAVDVPEEGENFSIFFLETSSIMLLGLENNISLIGTPVNIGAILVNNTAPIPNANMVANISIDGNESQILALLDDGLHNDLNANDGIYGNYFTPQKSGTFNIEFKAEGEWERIQYKRNDLSTLFVTSDTDMDGILDYTDNCRSMNNSDQNDSDNDRIGNPCDNCPAVFNPDQLDSDLDSVGNSCDKEVQCDETTPGVELRINNYTDSDQVSPTVAMDSGGNYIVAWSSQNQDGLDWKIFAQRFDLYSNKIGGDFQVNQENTGGKWSSPDIANSPDGSFIVTWRSQGDIHAQIFDSNRSRLGNEFLVNNIDPELTHLNPSIAMDANGNFIIAWQVIGNSNGIYAQRYDANGSKIGGEIEVYKTTTTTFFPIGPDVAIDSNGRFVVTWHLTEGSIANVYAQRFDSIGNRDGEIIQVSSLGGSTSAITLFSDGEFLITWQNIDIFAQRFYSNGSRKGEQFRVNSFSLNNYFSSIAKDNQDNYIIVWQGFEQDGSDYGIVAQKYDNFDRKLGLEILINKQVSGRQIAPVVAMSAVESFVVAWESDLENSGFGIYARKFSCQTSSCSNNIKDENEQGRDCGGVCTNACQIACILEPQTEEFLMNNFTSGNPKLPSVAMGFANNFITVWENRGQSNDTQIYAQRFDDSGTSTGPEFLVNSNNSSSRINPEVSSNINGSIIVVWNTAGGNDSFGNSVYGQRFDRGGSKLGDQFKINTYDESNQEFPDVAMDQLNNFIVVWQSNGQDSDLEGIFGQSYDSNGNKLGEEFQVNNISQSYQIQPSVAMNSKGNFIVVWKTQSADGIEMVVGQRFNSNRSKEGAQFTITLNQTVDPKVAMDWEGNFIVIWTRNNTVTSNDVYAQLFNKDGTRRLNQEILVNNLTSGSQSFADVAADADGNFIIVWQSLDQDSSSNRIFGQWFDMEGEKIGGEIHISAFTDPLNLAYSQEFPSVSISNEGLIIVVWNNFNPNDELPDEGIYGRLYKGKCIDNDIDHVPDYADNCPSFSNFDQSDNDNDGAGDACDICVFDRDNDMDNDSICGDIDNCLLLENNNQADHDSDDIGDLCDNCPVIYNPDQLNNNSNNEGDACETQCNQTMIGDELIVNSFINNSQFDPSIAINNLGYTITWQSNGQDGSLEGIFAKFFDHDDTVIKEEFPVNIYSNLSQNDPSVAMDPFGNFVITWVSENQDGSGKGIFAQRFSRDSLPQGQEFQVNTNNISDQENPAVAIDLAGNFVVAWESRYEDSPWTDIYAQRFGYNGEVIGPEFLVNTYTYSYQKSPTVGMDSQGNFVIAWQSFAQDGDSNGIFARRFNSNGNPLESEFQINTFTPSFQEEPDIAMNAKGMFAIAWNGFGPNSTSTFFDIFVKLFDANGSQLSGDIKVNNHSYEPSAYPAVSIDSEGNFIVTWSGFQGTFDIYAQMFDKNGNKQGDEFRINNADNFDDLTSDIAYTQDNFAVTWSSLNGGQFDIKKRNFKCLSLCHNKVLDNGETDIDCGGSCSKCLEGKSCLQDTDCITEYCSSSKICSIDSPPIITIFNPQNITYTSLPIPFSVSLNEPGTCNYTLNEGMMKFTMATNASNTSFTSSNNSIANGKYSVRYFCTDLTGNLNSSVKRNFSVNITPDFTPPRVTILSPVNKWVYNNATIFFNFALNEPGSCMYSLTLGKTNFTMTANTTQTGFNATKTLADKKYTLKAYCNDTAGNKNNSVVISFTIDTKPPRVTIIDHRALAYNVSKIPFNVTISESGACNYTLTEGLRNYTMQKTSKTSFTALNTSIADGNYRARYYCTDLAGNLNSTAARNFIVDSP